MFSRLRLMAAGTGALLTLGVISLTPPAQAHGDHGYRPHGHEHGWHHHHRRGKQKAYNHGYRRGYRRALKQAYRSGYPIYRPVIHPAHPVVVHPHRIAPHRSWLSLGVEFPL